MLFRASLGSRCFPVRAARDRYMGSKVGGASGTPYTCHVQYVREKRLEPRLVESWRNPSIIAHAINIDKLVTSAMWITRKHVPLWDLPAGLVGAQLRVNTPLTLLIG